MNAIESTEFKALQEAGIIVIPAWEYVEELGVWQHNVTGELSPYEKEMPE